MLSLHFQGVLARSLDTKLSTFNPFQFFITKLNELSLKFFRVDDHRNVLFSILLE